MGGHVHECLHLLQLAAVTQYQLAQIGQLSRGKAGCVAVFQHIGTVAVVVAARDAAAHFVQQTRPCQHGRCMGLCRVQLLPQLLGGFCHMAGVQGVDAKALHQAEHGGGVDIAHLFIVHQTVEHAHAQRALGNFHALQPQQIEHGTQHAQATRNHGAAVFF